MVPNTVRVAVGILGTPHLHVLLKSFVFMNGCKTSLSLLQEMLLLCSSMQHQCTCRIQKYYAWSEIDTTYAIFSYALRLMFHRLTFRRVVKKGNVEEFSCVPYILALFNCLLYTWYGLPVVSSGWENFPVSTINGVGILLEITFISIYIWFAPSKKKASDLRRIILFYFIWIDMCKLLNTVNTILVYFCCRGLPCNWWFLLWHYLAWQRSSQALWSIRTVCARFLLVVLV